AVARHVQPAVPATRSGCVWRMFLRVHAGVFATDDRRGCDRRQDAAPLLRHGERKVGPAHGQRVVVRGETARARLQAGTTSDGSGLTQGWLARALCRCVRTLAGGLALWGWLGLTRGGWRDKACSFSRASTAPSPTWLFRLDAVPHTVLGTHAGALSWQSWRPSTWRLRVRTPRRAAGSTVSLRGLSRPGSDLQLLRPRPSLLRRQLRAASAAPQARHRRTALPDQPPRAARPCRASASLPGALQ